MICATERKVWPECFNDAIAIIGRNRSIREIGDLLHVEPHTLTRWAQGGYPHNKAIRDHLRFMLGLTLKQLPEPEPKQMPDDFPNDGDKRMMRVLECYASIKHGHVEPSYGTNGHEDRMREHEARFAFESENNSRDNVL